jgi:hypothetical protein
MHGSKQEFVEFCGEALLGVGALGVGGIGIPALQVFRSIALGSTTAARGYLGHRL